MPIDSLRLTGFTAFEDAQFDFAPGVNVLIGPNGSGKTHAMKIAYCVLRALEPRRAGTTP